MIVYLTRSPLPLTPFPLSIISADFKTLIDGVMGDKLTTVKSFSVLPSPSSPSSLKSLTSFELPGLLAQRLQLNVA